MRGSAGRAVLPSDEGVPVSTFRMEPPALQPVSENCEDLNIAELIAKFHEQSLGTYGWLRITAELQFGSPGSPQAIRTTEARTQPGQGDTPTQHERIHYNQGW